MWWFSFLWTFSHLNGSRMPCFAISHTHSLWALSSDFVMVSVTGFTFHTFSADVLLPAATKLGQGNIFRSVCKEFCPQGGQSGPQRGCLQFSGGVFNFSGGSPNFQGGGSPTFRGISNFSGGSPIFRGVSKFSPTPPIRLMSGRYASYWNAF